MSNNTDNLATLRGATPMRQLPPPTVEGAPMPHPYSRPRPQQRPPKQPLFVINANPSVVFAAVAGLCIGLTAMIVPTFYMSKGLRQQQETLDSLTAQVQKLKGPPFVDLTPLRDLKAEVNTLRGELIEVLKAIREENKMMTAGAIKQVNDRFDRWEGNKKR